MVEKRKSITMAVDGPGRELQELMIKAAGLEGHRIKSLEVRVASKEAITFTAEFYGTVEDISEALKAKDS